MEQWSNGAVEQWSSGAVEQWSSGGLRAEKWEVGSGELRMGRRMRMGGGVADRKMWDRQRGEGVMGNRMGATE